MVFFGGNSKLSNVNSPGPAPPLWQTESSCIFSCYRQWIFFKPISAQFWTIYGTFGQSRPNWLVFYKLWLLRMPFNTKMCYIYNSKPIIILKATIIYPTIGIRLEFSQLVLWYTMFPINAFTIIFCGKTGTSHMLHTIDLHLSDNTKKTCFNKTVKKLFVMFVRN